MPAIYEDRLFGFVLRTCVRPYGVVVRRRSKKKGAVPKEVMRHRFGSDKRERKMAWYFYVVAAAVVRGHKEQFFSKNRVVFC